MEKYLSMNGGLLSHSPLCSNVCDQHFDGIIKYSSYPKSNSKQCRDHLQNGMNITLRRILLNSATLYLFSYAKNELIILPYFLNS